MVGIRTHGNWLDVSVGDKHYYGVYMYQTTESDGRVLAASGVLLTLWDDRPDCSISMEGQNTVVEVRGRKNVFSGRPLLRLNSSNGELEVVAKDLGLSNYVSRKQMTEAVRKLLSAEAAPKP